MTLTEPAGKLGVYPNMIPTWKRRAGERVIERFTGNAAVGPAPSHLLGPRSQFSAARRPEHVSANDPEF